MAKINRGDPNHLLNGMILQVHPRKLTAGTWKGWEIQVRNLLLQNVHFQVNQPLVFEGCKIYIPPKKPIKETHLP